MSDEKNEKITQSIIKKIRDEYGEEALKVCYETKELPALKLSNEETEFLKGGFLFFYGLAKLFGSGGEKDWDKMTSEEKESKLIDNSTER